MFYQDAQCLWWRDTQVACYLTLLKYCLFLYLRFTAPLPGMDKEGRHVILQRIGNNFIYYFIGIFYLLQIIMKNCYRKLRLNA